MGEIKLKMWNGKEIIDVKSIDFDDIGNLYHVNGELVNPLEVELLQYTGLKDKNGKEIYEGDIIQYKSEIMAKKIWNCEIERIGATFAVRTGEKTYMDGSYLNILARGKECEVIGNIYKNKELLEEE